jgi:hypothetical protein
LCKYPDGIGLSPRLFYHFYKQLRACFDSGASFSCRYRLTKRILAASMAMLSLKFV